MPFTETCRMEERVRMLLDYETGNWSVTELCARYGVCRDTFYDWQKRREIGAGDWFVDRSHAPFHRPHETEASLKGEIVSLRRRFPHLGPRKLLRMLERRDPETCWPAASTIGGILKQAGLIAGGKRRRRAIDQLPLSIRSDNGAPFGSSGPGGLTRLSAWWLKLGVKPHFIRPASPQENGRHERMHRTLKKETSCPPSANAAQQQARFDDFRRHYNQERPHEALGQRPPADLYAPSPRPMPERVEDPWYDANHQVRRVRNAGEIKWQGELLFVSQALVGDIIGIAELETGDHVVRFCDLDIGLIDRRGRFRRFAPLRDRLRKPAEPATTSKMSGIMPVQNVDNHLG